MKKIIILGLSLLLSSCIYEGGEIWVILSNQNSVNGTLYNGTRKECNNFIKGLKYSAFIGIENTTFKCVALKDLP